MEQKFSSLLLGLSSESQLVGNNWVKWKVHLKIISHPCNLSHYCKENDMMLLLDVCVSQITKGTEGDCSCQTSVRGLNWDVD